MHRPGVVTLDCASNECLGRKVKELAYCLLAQSPVMCEIEISNCRKINLIIAYCFIFVLREEHLNNAFA